VCDPVSAWHEDVESMTQAEWQVCDDAWAMIEFLWCEQGISPADADLRISGDRLPSSPTNQSVFDLDRALHRYYLASCRAIWKLLPQEASRRGVELAEQFLAGTVSGEEVRSYNRDVEGAAFRIDYGTDPGAIDRWVADVGAIPEVELRAMLHPPEAVLEIEPRELLKRAAYFVDYAMIYPSLSPKGSPPLSYRHFLSADVLREHVEYPTGVLDR
jgi:hypothetical protein